jgi:hypothetical protein
MDLLQPMQKKFLKFGVMPLMEDGLRTIASLGWVRKIMI